MKEERCFKSCKFYNRAFEGILNEDLTLPRRILSVD